MNLLSKLLTARTDGIDHQTYAVHWPAVERICAETEAENGYTRGYADGLQAASDYIATHSETTLIGGLGLELHLMAKDARGK
jgi:hypothetical protein